MRIGIMTFFTSADNYGQQLQCYALQKYLKDLGHDAYLIRYDAVYDFINKFSNFKMIPPTLGVKISSIIRKIVHSYKIFIPGFLKQKKLLSKHNQLNVELRKFSEFQKDFLSVSDKFYMSYNELVEDPPVADVYMTGSDQVWNFPGSTKKESTKARIGAFMLDFGSKEIKRIAASASWGKTSIEDDKALFLKPFLKKLDAITVREKSGIELCRQCGSSAKVVADPTLYLEANDYRRIYQTDEIRKPSKPYIMVYWVNNGGNPPMEKIIEWGNKKNLSIEYVTANCMIDNYEKNYATVPEWLYLVDHAEYVITNSFHGCVFSLLFEKRFGAIKIQGKEKGMNSRLDSLFENCHVSPRFIDDSFSCLEMEPEKIKLNEELKLKNAIADVVKL